MLEMGRGFSAVRHRNFRLYWIGQIVSLAGTWMQSVSQPWLVLLLGGSYIQLGIVVALQFGAFGLKVVLLAAFQLLIRWTLPRFRADQLMNLGWKLLLPLSLINIMVVALIKLIAMAVTGS